jgi:hypothetical protein
MLNSIVVSIRFILLILCGTNRSPCRTPPCASNWPYRSAQVAGSEGGPIFFHWQRDNDESESEQVLELTGEIDDEIRRARKVEGMSTKVPFSRFPLNSNSRP